MKKLILLLPIFFIILISGCTSSDGEYDKENTSTAPLVFESTLSKDSTTLILKKLLAETDIFISENDKEIGLILTKPRLLNKDEKYSLDWFSSAMLAIKSTTQYGFIKFMYNEDTLTVFSTNFYLTFEVTQNVNIFKDNTIKSEEIITLPQGHPFSTKLKKLISKNKHFKLIKQ